MTCAGAASLAQVPEMKQLVSCVSSRLKWSAGVSSQADEGLASSNGHEGVSADSVLAHAEGSCTVNLTECNHLCTCMLYSIFTMCITVSMHLKTYVAK